VRLVDWDTVALAPADRDLWFVTGDRTSRYALRWPVEDLALFAQTFRAPHRATKDDRAALGYLAATLAALT
jgi:spectinomycin phosphotransferase